MSDFRLLHLVAYCQSVHLLLQSWCGYVALPAWARRCGVPLLQPGEPIILGQILPRNDYGMIAELKHRYQKYNMVSICSLQVGYLYCAKSRWTATILSKSDLHDCIIVFTLSLCRFTALLPSISVAEMIGSEQQYR